MKTMKRSLYDRGMTVKHKRMIMRDRSDWRAVVNVMTMIDSQYITYQMNIIIHLVLT